MHKIKPLIHHPQSMIKCLVAGVFLVGLFSTIWVANDPKIQKRIKDERAAKSLVKEQEAKKKKEDWDRDALEIVRSTGEGFRQLLFLVAALPILSQQQIADSPLRPRVIHWICG